MIDLESSSDYKDKGLLSPRARSVGLRRILIDMRYPEQKQKLPESIEVEAMQDLCFHLYSEEAAGVMSERLGVSVQDVREALDIGLKWKI